jgi:hypothetical protein
MTEQQIRENVVAIARSWLGCKESDGTHQKIIVLYNSHKPLARGYAVKYDDAWCATFVSAVFVKAGLTDIAPTECGCEAMIKLYKNHAASKWEENEAITPEIGDVVFYDWQDTGSGDNTGAADHVGIVAAVLGTSLVVIEGNYSNSVKERTLSCNGKYLRGYGKPAYSTKAEAAGTGDNPTEWAKEATEWCKAQGIFNGDGQGNYDWQKPITREAVAQIMYNALKDKL